MCSSVRSTQACCAAFKENWAYVGASPNVSRIAIEERSFFIGCLHPNRRQAVPEPLHCPRHDVKRARLVGIDALHLGEQGGKDLAGYNVRNRGVDLMNRP